MIFLLRVFNARFSIINKLSDSCLPRQVSEFYWSHLRRYMFGRTRFLDGFEVHFLCEYTGYWHMTEDVGFWLGTPPQLQRSAPGGAGGSAGAKRATSGGAGAAGAAAVGPGSTSQVSVLLNLALSFVQV